MTTLRLSKSEIGIFIPRLQKRPHGFARAFKTHPIRPFPEGVRPENRLGNILKNPEEKRNVRRCPGVRSARPDGGKSLGDRETGH